jgi:hypothetical protein
MASKIRKRSSSQIQQAARHESHCTICSHPQREEIEHSFISWASPAAIVEEYQLGSRYAIYRHGHATGLMETRGRNMHAALWKIIEQVDQVEPTAASVILAIALSARINARGEIMQRSEVAGVHEQYSKMTRDELLVYAESGRLPNWFLRSAAPKGPEGSGEDGDV